MRSLGVEGVKRSKRVRIIRPDPKVLRHPDSGKRVFSSAAPNQLSVKDLTFVPTRAANSRRFVMGERLAEIGAVPSIGSVGDSFENAMAQTVNGH